MGGETFEDGLANCERLNLSAKGQGNKDDQKASVATRDMYIEAYLEEAGDYLIVAEVDWIEYTYDKTFALTCYSEHPVVYEDISDSV